MKIINKKNKKAISFNNVKFGAIFSIPHEKKIFLKTYDPELEEHEQCYAIVLPKGEVTEFHGTTLVIEHKAILTIK